MIFVGSIQPWLHGRYSLEMLFAVRYVQSLYETARFEGVVAGTTLEYAGSIG
jgi:hypothetical protein